jgi:anti-anti-sigma regulatory factor
MEFKIDTNTNFTQITPVTNHLDANLAEALSQKCRELTESGSQNFIVDLHNCLDADKASFEALATLHESCYENEHSLVFTGLQDDVLQILKDEEIDHILNIAPKMIEAIDIVNMEILERDLFKEE